MKTMFLSILVSIIFSSCEKQQEITINNIETNTRMHSLTLHNKGYVQLFVFSGESNAQGCALNTFPTISELSPQPQLQIWNSVDNEFQDLHIGYNNILRDRILGNSTLFHGWELQLSNILRQQSKTAYLIKTAQCGTKIIDWDSSGVLFHDMRSKLDSALREIRRLNPNKGIQVFVFYSQGINDCLYGQTSTVEWKTRTVEHLKNIRNITGRNTRIILCQNLYAYNNYNQTMEDISLEDTTGLTSFVTADSVTTQDPDTWGMYGVHYDYNGYKLLTDKMYGNIQNYIRY